MRTRLMPIDRPAAEDLAVAGLSFLAAEPERFAGFLEATGLRPETIRAAASDPNFLAGLLDFIAADEPLLMAFAAESGEPPERVMLARQRLSPVTPQDP